MMTTITPCLSPLARIVGREPQGDLAESPTQRDQTAIANQDLFILRRRRRRRQRQRRVPYRILTGEKSLLNGWRQAGRQATPMSNASLTAVTVSRSPSSSKRNKWHTLLGRFAKKRIFMTYTCMSQILSPSERP